MLVVYMSLNESELSTFLNTYIAVISLVMRLERGEMCTELP